MTTPDLVLLAYIILIVPAMLVGFIFARRQMFVPYHKFTMTTITIVNWLLIIFVMFVTYRRDVLPNVPQNLSAPGNLIPTLHLIPGLIAQLLATYLVIRMWFENQLPGWFKVNNIKVFMRLTLGLWLLTAVLGVITWAVTNKGFLTPAVVANTTAGTNVVQLLSGNKFEPASLSITTGTTIQFVNNDTRTHTVTADDGSFDSGDLKPGQTFTHTFGQPGDVAYYCTYHGDKGGVGMAAVIHITGNAVNVTNPTNVPTLAPVATEEATNPAPTAATSGTASASSAAVQTVTVTMNDDTFDPKTITVPAGTIIHFVNAGKHKHTVTADDNSFDSGQLKAGDTFDHTFATAGDVPLYCQNHGDKGGQGMSMVVHVTGSAASVTNPTTAPTLAPAVTEEATKPAPTATTSAGSATTASAAAQTVTVNMNDDAFDPKAITVPAGTIIHFVNAGKHKHTVTADDNSFDSGQLKPGDTFDHTFATTGDVPLYCQNHGDKGGQGMSMVVHVTAASVTAASTSAPATSAPAATKAIATAQATTLDPKVVAALNPLVVSADDTPNKTAYAVGMQSQLAIFNTQLALIPTALSQGHIEDAQAAAEAVLNLIQGGAGKDLDADGKINQPGDGYGLQKYVFGVNEAASNLQDATQASDPLNAAAVAMQSTGRDVLKDLQSVSQAAQALIDAKTLVDAQKVGPTLVSATGKLDADIAAIIQKIPAVPGSHLTGN